MKYISVWKRYTKLTFSVVCLFLLLLSVSACSNKQAQDIEGPADAVAVFKQRCMSCHGVDFKGRMGPESNLQQVGSRLSAEQIITIVKEGGDRMPAQSNIKEEDVVKVAEWLATLK